MADDTILNLGSGGDTIATDDIGPGVKYQRVKLTLGADGVNDGDVSSTNPIPTDLQEVDGVAIAPAQTDDDAIAAALIHQAVISLMHGYDGANWERLQTNASGFLKVQPGAGQVYGNEAHDAPATSEPIRIAGKSSALASSVTLVSADDDVVDLALDRRGVAFVRLVDNSGDEVTDSGANSVQVSVVSDLFFETDDGTVAGAQVALRRFSLGYGWDGANWERLQTDGSGALDVNVTTLPGSAHDAPVSGNPVRIAGKANANEPTAVADDDTVDTWMDQLGRLVVVAGHPSPELPITIEATGAGDTQVIAAPGASVSLYIKRVLLSNEGSAVNPVFLQENGSAVNRGGGALAADGGGVILDFGDRGWKLTANTALEVNLENAGSVWVSVLDYYIAA